MIVARRASTGLSACLCFLTVYLATINPHTVDASPPLVEESRVLLEAARQATLSSQIAAHVQEITVEEGQSFQAGDLLLRFDCGQQEAQLRLHQATLEGARKTRQVHLQMNKMGTISQLEMVLSQVEVEKAEAQVNMSRVDVSYCTIKAPYEGRLVRRKINPHDSVAKGAPLLEIIDTGNLRTRLYVPARWQSWLKPGTPFQVRLDDDGRDFPATVTLPGAAVDGSSQTLTVLGEITGHFPELLPGLSGVARFSRP